MEISSASSYAAQSYSVAAKVREEQAVALQTPAETPAVEAGASSGAVCPECGVVHGPGQGHGAGEGKPSAQNPEEIPNITGLRNALLVSANAATALQEESSRPESFGGLSEEERVVVEELQERDQEVRDHERAHQAASGGLAGAASYTYEQGPDGRSYAVGGEVSIDTAPVQGDPEASIEKFESVRAAALAPAEPSSQDQAVAAQASAAIQAATAELQTQSSGPGEDVEASEEADALAPTGQADEAAGEEPVAQTAQTGQQGETTAEDSGADAGTTAADAAPPAGQPRAGVPETSEPAAAAIAAYSQTFANAEGGYQRDLGQTLGLQGLVA